MIWFVSELHFGHQRIIDLCGRPFSSVNEMNRVLLENWNSRIEETDDFYIIGDLFCREEKEPEHILKMLKGKKHLILGNHDPMWICRNNCDLLFESVDFIKHIDIDGVKLTLCHYPMIEWPSNRVDNAELYGFLVHGHVVIRFFGKKKNTSAWYTNVFSYVAKTRKRYILGYEMQKVHYFPCIRRFKLVSVVNRIVTLTFNLPNSQTLLQQSVHHCSNLYLRTMPLTLHE